MIKKLSIKSFIFLSVFSGVLTADSYKFGVGSCLDQDFPQPIWNQIKEEDLNQNQKQIIRKVIWFNLEEFK